MEQRHSSPEYVVYNTRPRLVEAAKRAEDILADPEARYVRDVVWATSRVASVYDIHPSNIGTSNQDDILYDLKIHGVEINRDELQKTFEIIQALACNFYEEASHFVHYTEGGLKNTDRDEIESKGRELVDELLWKAWKPKPDEDLATSLNKRAIPLIRTLGRAVYRRQNQDFKHFFVPDEESEPLLVGVDGMDSVLEDLETNRIFRAVISEYDKNEAAVMIALMRGYNEFDLLRMGIPIPEITLARNNLSSVAQEYSPQFALMVAGREMQKHEDRSITDLKNKLQVMISQVELKNILKITAQLEPNDRRILLSTWHYFMPELNSFKFKAAFNLNDNAYIRSFENIVKTYEQMLASGVLESLTEVKSISELTNGLEDVQILRINGHIARRDSLRIRLLKSGWTNIDENASLLTEKEKAAIQLALAGDEHNLIYSDADAARELEITVDGFNSMLKRILLSTPEERRASLGHENSILYFPNGQKVPATAHRMRLLGIFDQITDDVREKMDETDQEALRLMLEREGNTFANSNEDIATRLGIPSKMITDISERVLRLVERKNSGKPMRKRRISQYSNAA